MGKLPIYIIINETHTLLDEQKALIEKFQKRRFLRKDIFRLEIVKVPVGGWTLAEMKEKGRRMMGSPVIFVSPIPYLIKFLAGSTGTDVYVFHNDNREKKELPDGRIIQTVAKTGWQLV